MPILGLCRTNWFLHCGFDLQNCSGILEFVFSIEQINTACQFVWVESETNRHLNGWLHTGPHQNRPMGFTANPRNSTCNLFTFPPFSTHICVIVNDYILLVHIESSGVSKKHKPWGLEPQLFNTHVDSCQKELMIF